MIDRGGTGVVKWVRSYVAQPSYGAQFRDGGALARSNKKFGGGGLFAVEITGCDLVVFTFTPPREVLARMLASVLARWPAALVDGFDEPPAGPEPVVQVPSERLPIDGGHLLFYRDEAMARHREEAAYVPMADGDGPFAVITRVRQSIEFEVAGLNELHAADHTPGGVRPPKPYPAWLCAQKLIEVTAVTPGDPEFHAFSSWVLGEVKRACCELAESARCT